MLKADLDKEIQEGSATLLMVDVHASEPFRPHYGEMTIVQAATPKTFLENHLGLYTALDPRGDPRADLPGSLQNIEKPCKIYLNKYNALNTRKANKILLTSKNLMLFESSEIGF